MKASSGLTLIEVLIAIVVLAVGVLAAASMQTSALSASSRARIAQEVTNTARTEMERQRQVVRSGISPASLECLPTSPSCTVTVAPCRIVTSSGTPALSCTTGTGPVVADQVIVRVVGPQSSTVELRTVVAR